MNPPTVLPIVVSLLLVGFIHSSYVGPVLGDIEKFSDAKTVAESSHQLSSIGPAKSGPSLSNAESAAVLNKFAADRPLPTRETSLLPQRTSTGGNPAAHPSSVEPVAGYSSAVPKNKFTKLPRAFTSFFERLLVFLGIRQKLYRLPPPPRIFRPDLPEKDLIKAQKEIKILGDFYNQINQADDSLKKAKILEVSMDTLKGLSVEKVTRIEYEAWLQTFAAMMQIEKPNYVPDVRMEAIAQHGLRDLEIKFDKSLEDWTRPKAYIPRTATLRRLLERRFSEKGDTPVLEAEAHSVPWASAVLYPDRPIKFDSDLARYEEWLTADKTLAPSKTLEELKTTRPGAHDDQKALLNALKVQADMFNKQTSSQEKSAATIVLCMLAYASRKNGEIFGQTSEYLQQQARQSMAEFVNEGVYLPDGGPQVTVFHNNAQTMEQFQIKFFYDLIHDDKNFRFVVLPKRGDFHRRQFYQMKYDALVTAMEVDFELVRYVRNVFQNPERPKSEAIKIYMDKLMNTPTQQINADRYNMYIQAFAHTMAVDQEAPIDLQTEATAQFGLLNLMAKFSVGEDELNRKLLRSARGLQGFLSERLNRARSIQVVDQDDKTPWATEVLFPRVPINLKSIVRKHEEWFMQDANIGAIFTKFTSPFTADREGPELMAKLKAMATIASRETSAQQKTASLWLLIHLGYPAWPSSLAVSRDLQNLAVKAIDQLREQANNLLLPNNAARVKMFPRLATQN